jgi:glycosyltransferase involved in cell wall biosynthesis
MARWSMPEPLFSVVLPARNEERLIGAALRSIAAQELPAGRLEAIVVSNGSTDRTVEVAQEEAARIAAAGGPRIAVLAGAPPGIALAKNRGAAQARGRVLVFLDADSEMSPGLLAAIERRVERGERAASIRLRPDNDDPIDRALFWILEYGKRVTRVRANMLWCERALFERLHGFDETLHQAEDLDLLVRAKRAGIRVGHVNEAWIVTSTRRLHRGPLRLGMFRMLGRWVLGHVGIGRHWPYSGGGSP